MKINIDLLQRYIVFFQQEQLLNTCDADYYSSCKPLVRYQSKSILLWYVSQKKFHLTGQKVNYGCYKKQYHQYLL